MRLRTIAFRNLRRRTSRSAFLVAGLLVGIGTVVALLTLSQALTVEAQNNLETFGANIVVAPRSEGLSLTYGGVSVADVAVGSQEIREADLERIDTIPNRRNIAIVAPELLGVVSVKGREALLLGVRPERELELKKWWRVDGRPPRGDRELVAGAAAAKTLGLRSGDTVAVGGRRFLVTGILRPDRVARTTTCSSPTWEPPRACSASRAPSPWSRWPRSAATARSRRSPPSSAARCPGPRSR